MARAKIMSWKPVFFDAVGVAIERRELDNAHIRFVYFLIEDAVDAIYFFCFKKAKLVVRFRIQVRHSIILISVKMFTGCHWLPPKSLEPAKFFLNDVRWNSSAQWIQCQVVRIGMNPC